MNSGTIRVTFGAGMIAWAKGFLEEEGYVVEKPRALHLPETPAQFCQRVKIHIGTFSRKIRLPKCPDNFESDRGPKGRINWLSASRELEQFMQTNINEIRKGKR